MSFRLNLFAAVLGGAALAGCSGGGSTSSGTPAPAGAVTVAGVVGGSPTALTLAGHPLTISGAVTVNGRSISGATVLPGSVIHGKSAGTALGVKAATTAGSAPVTLTEVDVSIEIVGTIDSIDVAAGTLQVQGQTVTVDALTEIVDDNPDGTTSTITLADLTVGDYVEVSGNPIAAGGVQASLIEKTLIKSGDAQYGETDVHGVVSSLDTNARTFVIGADTVSYGSASVQGTLANGAMVEVAGSVSGTAITATEVQVEDSPTGTTGEDTELNGQIQQLDSTAQTFVLLGYTIDYSAISPAPTLQEGASVEVQGTVDATNANVIHATSLQVDCSQPGDGNANGEAKGQVTAIDTVGMTVTLGTSVFWADASTLVVQNDSQITFDQIAVGSWIELKFDSTRQQNGASYATTIDVQGSSSDGGGGTSGEVDVEGPVSAFDGVGQTLTVNSQSIGVDANTTYQAGDQMLTATTFWATDRTGQTVEVHAHTSNSALIADKIEVKTQD